MHRLLEQSNFPKLIYLQLFTELFYKDFSLPVRINSNYCNYHPRFEPQGLINFKITWVEIERGKLT